MSTLFFLPEANFAPAKRSDLKRTSAKNESSERDMTLAAENAPIRITYGRSRVVPQFANVLNDSRHWYVQVVWGEGPIQAIESVTFSDEPVPSRVDVTHYLGTANQTVDPWMVTAFAEQSITYQDALPGIAYSVFKIPVGLETGWESMAGILQGRLLYDPRTTLTVYSENPTLALADFLTNPVYGCGWTLDWSSVIAPANANDELVGGFPRRMIGLTLENVAPVESWIETLRTYAGCFAPVLGPNGWKLIQDRPTAVTSSFSHTDGNLSKLEVLRKRGLKDTPTFIRLFWTDTSEEPWRDVPTIAALPGVIEGTYPRRESEIRLPGIHNASQAYREAVERLNKLTLNDLAFDIEVFDSGLTVEAGDVVSVTHPIGLNEKQMRVVNVTGSSGRYNLSLSEYQPSMYSSAVVSDPLFYDTNLPSLFGPTPPTALVLSEEIFQQQTGTFASQIVASWTASTFAFVDHYRVVVSSGADLIFTGTTSGTTFRTAAVNELLTYQVDVFTVSSVGEQSDELSDTIYTLGKYLPPSNVPSLDGFEVGGQVRLRWQAAVDIDIWRYEIRYGVVGGTWANGVLIDRVDALTMVTTIVPVGDWDFMIKALDSVNNFSPSEARLTLSVTKDDASFLAGFYDYDTPTTTSMHEYSLGRVGSERKFVTTSSVAWNTAFSTAMSGFANPVLSYFSATSELLTEVNDFGFLLAGNWGSSTTTVALSGTFSDQMELSTDAVSWENFPLMTTKGLFRFSRVRLNSTGVMLVTMPGVRTTIDAQPRTENGQLTTNASGASTVTLQNQYSAVKTLTLTPTGTLSRTAVVDNVVLGNPSSFDIYLFNNSGSQISGDVFWVFEGV